MSDWLAHSFLSAMLMMRRLLSREGAQGQDWVPGAHVEQSPAFIESLGHPACKCTGGIVSKAAPKASPGWEAQRPLSAQTRLLLHHGGVK